MVTLKPNYSHLSSSLLAMLLLMAALKCTTWQGAGWAAQTSHRSLGRARSSSRHTGPGSLWHACSRALWRTGAPWDPLQWDPLQGDTWHATKASARQGPQRAWPHGLRNSAVQDCVRGWLQQKRKLRGSTSVALPPESLLNAPSAPADPQLLQDTLCRQIPTTSVAVRITRSRHIWCCFSLARLVLSIMFHVSVSMHSKNQVARLRPWVSKHSALTQENYNW